MKQIEFKQLERPMKVVIDKSRELGYSFDPDLNKYQQCQNIRDWLFCSHHIFTWVVPHRDYTFTPYYKNMRIPMDKPKKYARSENDKQAFVEGLLYALSEIK